MNTESTERLKFFRKEKNLSQEKIATALGITRGSYTQIELGNSGIQDEHLPKLMSLGMSLNWLFSGIGEMLINTEAPSINIGALNTGIAGTISHTYNNVGDCEKELAVIEERLAAARREIELKDEIISLLKNK